MKDESIYITVNHIDDFCAVNNLRVGDELTLKKDPDNYYDDEAIAVYDKNNVKVGYVANSVSTVARGSYSAGRLYDKIRDEAECIVKFMNDDMLIAEIDELTRNTGTVKESSNSIKYT